MIRLLVALASSVTLAGCIVAPPYGYAPAYGYGYYPAPAYYAPSVGVDIGIGHGWRR
ncbi:hypothetical protein [Paraburkholderia flava]|uniref:hypothetical protein n=1 Tax=Paraburkholderia flava TaxID=2547393 RepID=UPI001414EEA9|nr:hypothetical protein [Paraburkholderia flava]